jgi:hypothetical protein
MEQTTKALVTLVETGNAVINSIQDDNKVDFKKVCKSQSKLWD